MTYTHIEYVRVEDIKEGDTFQYVSDYDVFGTPIKTGPLVASDDAIVINGTVIIPFGGESERCFMSSFGKTVEKINGTE